MAGGRCPACGYDLAGTRAPRCPECGADARLEHAIDQRAVADRRRRLWGAVLVFLIPAATLAALLLLLL